MFKNCAPSTNCIHEINNTQEDNAKDIDIVMPMYNLIEYSDNYVKTSESLWQYCLDIPAVDNNNAIVDFTENNLTDSFTFKVKITSQTGNGGTKNLEIMVPLKYFSNFWRTLEMPLINCEINLILTWSENCVIVSTAQTDLVKKPEFDAKLKAISDRGTKSNSKHLLAESELNKLQNLMQPILEPKNILVLMACKIF